MSRRAPQASIEDLSSDDDDEAPSDTDVSLLAATDPLSFLHQQQAEAKVALSITLEKLSARPDVETLSDAFKFGVGQTDTL